MGKSNRSATKKESKSSIQCIEVLISRSCLASTNGNIPWTLSVYSLENHPVRKNHLAIFDSEIFHFMVYDWNRTIRNLLEDRQIPYSVLQFFSRDTIFGEEEVFPSHRDRSLIASLGPIDRRGNDEIPDNDSLLKGLPDTEEESADLLH